MLLGFESSKSLMYEFAGLRDLCAGLLEFRGWASPPTLPRSGIAPTGRALQAGSIQRTSRYQFARRNPDIQQGRQVPLPKN